MFGQNVAFGHFVLGQNVANVWTKCGVWKNCGDFLDKMWHLDEMWRNKCDEKNR